VESAALDAARSDVHSWHMDADALSSSLANAAQLDDMCARWFSGTYGMSFWMLSSNKGESTGTKGQS
jgi:hypothetical protein